MASKAFPFSIIALLFFFSRILLGRRRNPRSLYRKVSNVHLSQLKFQKFSSFAHRSELSNQSLIFDVEGALLRSSSLFPYFMLVAFEAGSILRALVLFLLYPFVCMVNEEMGLNIMVMVCFFGIKKDKCRVGRAVLPKFFLEDVGVEGFEALMMRSGRKVGVSDLPRVMVEGFLRDYLEVEFVVGRELKEFCGYYVGLMQDKKKDGLVLEEIFVEEKESCDVVGIGGFSKSLDHQLFSHCKEIYLVSETDKRNWHNLPKERYPKPLIFHDGRLVFKPTPLATLAMFMWIPFGFFLAIIRILIALLLPYKLVIPILTLCGMNLKQAKPQSSPIPATKQDKPKGILYVCNHRTLLDPLYLSIALNKPLTAVTYSLSRVSELLSPIRTVRLTRDREQDSKKMEKLLSQGDLVVCPEGTTCREPYLLRFSPLFAEMSDDIVPVAVKTHVTLFYGTTAGGLKCLDPLFFLMNPCPSYHVQLLNKVAGSSTSPESRFDVANQVQKQLGQVLGFECTRLTRKDKYSILAGNEGIVTEVGKNSLKSASDAKSSL